MDFSRGWWWKASDMVPPRRDVALEPEDLGLRPRLLDEERGAVAQVQHPGLDEALAQHGGAVVEQRVEALADDHPVGRAAVRRHEFAYRPPVQPAQGEEQFCRALRHALHRHLPRARFAKLVPKGAIRRGDCRVAGGADVDPPHTIRREVLHEGVETPVGAVAELLEADGHEDVLHRNHHAVHEAGPHLVELHAHEVVADDALALLEVVALGVFRLVGLVPRVASR